MPPLLRVRNLRIEFLASGRNPIHALNGASFELQSGDVLGVLGESGSGKSTLAKALLRLLPKRARISDGMIEFESRDLLTLPEEEMQQIRGARIAMIPQEPDLALNPVMKVGDQIAEVIHAHRDRSWRECRAEAAMLLEKVYLRSAERRMYDAYPHQLSGGQQQRVVIAQAVACEPALIVADEPTASLDPDPEEEILALLRALKRERDLSILFITHDPRILFAFADRVVVVYAGRIIEDAPAEQLLRAPQHPYSKALLACVLSPPGDPKFQVTATLPTIDGIAPDPESVSAGCSFAPRCARRIDVCDAKAPSPIETGDDRRVECFLYGN